MKSNLSIITQELEEAQKLLNQFINNNENLYQIEKASQIMISSIKNGGGILSCGNGGSSCDAMHFAEELTGRYRDNRPALPGVAISDSGFITCTANDFGYDQIFARYIEAWGKQSDTLLAISTSGNSTNVINAIKTAKSKGMQVIGLTGKDGGQMKDLCDIAIVVPHQGYADRIQEIHIKIIHIFIMLIEKGVA